MKILIIGLSNKLGGVEKVIFDYVSHIDFSDGLRIGILCEYDTVCFEREFCALGCTIERVCSRKNPAAYYRQICTVIKRGRYETVHLNMLSCANILPVLSAKRCKVRLIAHSHNSDVPKGCSAIMLLKRLLHKMNRRYVSNASDIRIACSMDAGFFMFGNRRAFTVLKNAVDTKEYTFNAEKRNLIRKEIGIGSNAVVVGHTGRFEYQKNQQFIIQVFAEYLKRNENARLVLVGTGSQENECKRLCKELSADGKVVFYGAASQAQIPALLSAFDVFIFPSRFEGFGLSAVEALCSGLPVIASNTVAKEMDVTGTVSWLSLKDDVSVWAEKIDSVLSTPFDRNGTPHIVAEKGYDISCNAALLKNIYRGE